MSHVLPQRLLQPEDVPDPEDLNNPLSRLGAKLAEGLGEQDLAAGLITQARVGVGAYYKMHRAEYTVDMGVATLSRYPVQTAPGSMTVEDSTAWSNLNVNVDMTTGQENVLILAQAQLVGWMGLLGDNPLLHSEEPYRVQFAIRLDGTVLDHTCTGQWYEDPPYQELYRAKAVSATKDFDFRKLRRTLDAWGLSNHIQPVRTMTTATLSAGAHTVELVARRLPRHDGELDDGGVGSMVRVFNRRLYVLRVVPGPMGGGPDSDGPVIPPLGESAPFGAVTFGNTFGAARSYINSVPETGVRSAALRAEHLPSMVTLKDRVMLSPNNPVGQTAHTYTGVSDYNGDPVHDGAGNTLELTNGGSGFDIEAAGVGVMVIQGNVQVWRIWQDSTKSDYTTLFVQLSYVNSAGTRVVIEGAEAAITPRNEIPDGEGGATLMSPQGTAPTQVPCEDDVPILWVFSGTQLIATDPDATTVQRFTVSLALHDSNATGGAMHVLVKNANVACAYLKGVELA